MKRALALLEPIDRHEAIDRPEVLKDLGVIYYYLRSKDARARPAAAGSRRSRW